MSATLKFRLSVCIVALPYSHSTTLSYMGVRVGPSNHPFPSSSLSYVCKCGTRRHHPLLPQIVFQARLHCYNLEYISSPPHTTFLTLRHPFIFIFSAVFTQNKTSTHLLPLFCMLLLLYKLYPLYTPQSQQCVDVINSFFSSFPSTAAVVGKKRRK